MQPSPNHGEGVQATGPISESPASEEQAEQPINATTISKR